MITRREVYAVKFHINDMKGCDYNAKYISLPERSVRPYAEGIV